MLNSFHPPRLATLMLRLLRATALLCMIGFAAAVLAGWLRPKPLTGHYVPDANSPPSANSTETEQETRFAGPLSAALAASWADAGVEPAEPAPWLLVARRQALGLAGTVPSFEELRWLDSIPETDRPQRYADYLLHDRRTADYLAERLARGLVGAENGPFLVFRRRRFVNWLSDALHDGRPYDQIIREVLTAEGIWTTNPPVNFVTATIQNDTEQPDADQLAIRTSRFVLGVRMDCAQCHDHPFDDRWKQSDFAGLAAFYAQTGFLEGQPLRGIRQREISLPQNDPMMGEWSATTPKVPFADELDTQTGPLRQRLAAWATHPANDAFARATANRFWAIVIGSPLVEPIDELPTEGDIPPALDALARGFVRSGYDWRRLASAIACGPTIRMQSQPEGEVTSAAAAFPLTPLRPEQVAGALVQASSLGTVDTHSHLVMQLVRFGNERDFLQRYGDAGDAEMAPRPGTIPQRLLMLNGKVTAERTEPNPIMTAAGRIPMVAGSDRAAIATAYLATLTREPTPQELEHFEKVLASLQGDAKGKAFSDLYWALVNSSEFSWSY